MLVFVVRTYFIFKGRKEERKKERTFVSFLIDGDTEIGDQQDVITKIS